ncbi:tyrosine-protein phosphatase non-receptor type substrate 1-like isoform X2 [Manacus candei]|uniref:tyrosine-protein phosphatase non-receptor type substrate 1-like isoform X2 n=1 Tax=Manacus candei TaxID=415023 RepID=UPI0022278D96|nr:tyrosine-protein phosphatase non-receptor type substrate 1-like isoform X2 [Manacus candei]
MAEGLPRGPRSAAPLKPNFKAGRQTFPFPARQGILQGHEEACCSHPFESTPCQLWERQISASSPNSLLEMVVEQAWGGSGAGAQGGQDFKVHQPQDKVSVKAGETLTLNCTISGYSEIGPVKWLKGWGSGNRTIYADTGSAPRVTRAVSGSDTDFTIHIRDVQPEDVGTYYCVKFTKSLSGGDVVFRRGTGTEVSVLAQPSPPIVSGPNQRAGPGQSVAFNCTAGGFFPKDISVKWFKDRAPISSQLPQVTEWREKSYNMSSSVTVVLGEGDVPSRLICEVQHSASETLLRGMYQLNRVLRVSPSVDVSPDQMSPIELNKTVKFTCHVKGFYPANVAVSWLENGMKMKVQNNSRPSLLHQGLLELRSQVEVQATEERNGSVFTCLVVHDDQAPVNQSAILWIASPDEKGPSKWSQINSGNLLIYVVVAVVCLVLALLVAAILYLIRTKQIKGKSSPTARLHEPEKSSEATMQESDPNNLTYADLNFDKERKTIRRMVEMGQQSEYACIQTSQAPNGDDNLTYADLDMVHLSKAPKRPAPRPEEASSEYASVQIPRK